MQFLTTVAGGLVLLGGLITFVIKIMPSIRQQVAWKTDLHVIAFDSSRGFTVLNTGDGPVLLSHVALEIEGIGSRTIKIDKIIKPLEVYQYNELLLDPTQDYYLLAHVQPAEWRAAVIAARITKARGCVVAAAFADTDPTYSLYSDYGRRDPHHFPTLRAGVSLHYYDLKMGGGQMNVPAHAYLFRRPDCAPIGAPIGPSKP